MDRSTLFLRESLSSIVPEVGRKGEREGRGEREEGRGREGGKRGEGRRKGERREEGRRKGERREGEEGGREKGDRLTALCHFTCSIKAHLEVGRLCELTGTVFCSWIGGCQLEERHIRVEPSVECGGHGNICINFTFIKKT